MPKTYRTQQGDAWDLISKKVYGDEYHSDVLMGANTAYRHVSLFPGGVVLTVPDIDTTVAPADNLPPWRKPS